MTPLGTVTTPDHRIMERLAGLIRRGAGVTPFITAGHALANAIVASRGFGQLPRWADDLADAMVGSLILVQQRSQVDSCPDRRVQLATAAAVLAMVRPRLERVCDGAITTWLGFGMAPAHCHDDATQLAARTLHFLRLDDTDAAADAVDALVDHGGVAAGMVLHDWTVSRVQGHGLSREVQCFHNLRLALNGAGNTASLQLLASLVVLRRAGRDGSEALHWLDQVATEIRVEGTSSLCASA